MTASRRRLVVVAPVDGGVATVAARTVDHLQRTSWQVESISVPRTDRSALFVALSVAWRHRRALRRADVVHAEFGRLDAEVFWLAAILVHLRRVVLVAHDAPDYPVKNPAARLAGHATRWRSRIGFRVLSPLLDRPVLWWVLRRARVGVVLTESARAGWTTGPRRIVVAPHGADPPSPDRVPPSAGTHVLFAGFLGRSKGLDLLLDAWDLVGDDAALPLWIAGAPTTADDGSWVEELQARSTVAANPPVWLGAVDDERWPRMFSEAAIVVLPYRTSNPASGILVRAMVEGRPVVATPTPAVAAVGGGDVIEAVPAGDVGALAGALRRLLDSGGERDALGRRAGVRAAQLWSWDRQVSALEEAYELALDGWSGRLRSRVPADESRGAR